MKIKNYSGRNFKKKRSADKISKRTRSRVMSRIRSKNTGLEEKFIRTLRTVIKNKFDTYRRDIKGNPDVVFVNRKICVFIDSDFWHGWQYPRWKHLLKNDFWRDKIERNRKRDRKVTVYLRRHGWGVIRVWEHSLKSAPSDSFMRIKKALRERGKEQTLKNA